MRHIRWVSGLTAAGFALGSMGTASAHDRIARADEAQAIPVTIALPLAHASAPPRTVLRVRAARDTTNFLPHAEFLFAPVQPGDTPR
ncbi:MAG TPA: hypothetical protein VJM11_11015 [Nevskiaceae bacterium]|nr:hypothetical protein [Nevskiaceae bacterium]